MRKTVPHSPDLFDLADIDDARREVERAETARNAAQKRVLYAPVGTKTERVKAFIDATNWALRAEGDLRRLMREAGLK